MYTFFGPLCTFGGSRIVLCGQTVKQKDMTIPIASGQISIETYFTLGTSSFPTVRLCYHSGGATCPFIYISATPHDLSN